MIDTKISKVVVTPEEATSTKPKEVEYQPISEHNLITEQDQEQLNLIEFTFKIDGMTCVACSNSIERLMHNSFDAKGM